MDKHLKAVIQRLFRTGALTSDEVGAIQFMLNLDKDKMIEPDFERYLRRRLPLAGVFVDGYRVGIQDGLAHVVPITAR